MKSKISVGDRATLASEIATLTEATPADLKSRWRVLYGAEPPPRMSRDLLTRAIAYRIQEKALGGLKPSTRRLVAKVAANASARRPIQVTPAPTLTPGTVLLRDWRGTQHQVIVREHGIEFQGKRYKSLSQVAHRITGKSGGCSFSRGALYELLANPIHSGEIRHKHERYPGQHEATVPRELWERVQQRLRINTAHGRQSSTSAIASPLAGKIFDADGGPLYAQGAAKAGRRYRYYVSLSLVNGSSSDDRKGWRLAAPELERAVAIATQHILSDRAGMLEVLERSEVRSADVRAIIESTSALCRRLENQADTKACMVELVDRIELCDDGVRVTLKIRVPCSRAGVQTSSILSLSRFVPFKMKRRGVETRIIIAAGNEPPRKVDSALLKAVARARVWFDELASGRVHSLAEIARKRGYCQALR
jgi:Protein of unknown function (DUF2924)/Recombinase